SRTQLGSETLSRHSIARATAIVLGSFGHLRWHGDRPTTAHAATCYETSMIAPCTHLEQADHRSHGVAPSGPGCAECLQTGGVWVHLRLCLTCGHVGCCDNSPGQHATKHFHGTKHPVIRSYEPAE